MIDRLSHTTVYVLDQEAARDFYVNKLGMQVKFTLNDRKGRPFGYYFACGNATFLEFFDQAMAVEEWGGQVAALTPGTQYRHFCLEVVGLDEYCQTLKSKGVEVSPITMGMDHSRQAWIADPDGNAIELMEYGPLSLQLTGMP